MTVTRAQGRVLSQNKCSIKKTQLCQIEESVILNGPLHSFHAWPSCNHFRPCPPLCSLGRTGCGSVLMFPGLKDKDPLLTWGTVSSIGAEAHTRVFGAPEARPLFPAEEAPCPSALHPTCPPSLPANTCRLSAATSPSAVRDPACCPHAPHTQH